MRPFISDGVHERFSLQFAEQKAEGYRNVMENVVVVAAAIVDSASDEIYDEVTVRIQARAAAGPDQLITQVTCGPALRGNSASPLRSTVRAHLEP